MLVIYAYAALVVLKQVRILDAMSASFPRSKPDANFPLLKPADSFPRRLTPVASFPRLAPICPAFGTGKF